MYRNQASRAYRALEGHTNDWGWCCCARKRGVGNLWRGLLVLKLTLMVLRRALPVIWWEVLLSRQSAISEQSITNKRKGKFHIQDAHETFSSFIFMFLVMVCSRQGWIYEVQYCIDVGPCCSQYFGRHWASVSFVSTVIKLACFQLSIRCQCSQWSPKRTCKSLGCWDYFCSICVLLVPWLQYQRSAPCADQIKNATKYLRESKVAWKHLQKFFF